MNKNSWIHKMCHFMILWLWFMIHGYDSWFHNRNDRSEVWRFEYKIETSSSLITYLFKSSHGLVRWITGTVAVFPTAQDQFPHQKNLIARTGSFVFSRFRVDKEDLRIMNIVHVFINVIHNFVSFHYDEENSSWYHE